MNAIIVDDTQAAIDNLVDKLQKYPDVSVVATCRNRRGGSRHDNETQARPALSRC